MEDQLVEKDLILSEVRYYQKVAKEYADLKEEYLQIQEEPSVVRPWWMQILGFIFLSNFAAFFFVIHPILGIVGLIGIIYITFIKPNNLKKKVMRNEHQADELLRQMNKIEKDNSPIYLPKDYIGYYSLTNLESYFVNKRADNLKEALNLFEAEKRHDEKMQELDVINKMQQKTMQKANEAVALGWFNFLRK